MEQTRLFEYHSLSHGLLMAGWRVSETETKLGPVELWERGGDVIITRRHPDDNGKLAAVYLSVSRRQFFDWVRRLRNAKKESTTGPG